MAKQILILFFLVTTYGYSQSVYKDATKINDSTDYYLEIGLFNKEEKKSYSKAILYTEKAIDFSKKNKLDNIKKIKKEVFKRFNIYVIFFI